MKVPNMIGFKLLHPRGREQSLDQQLTRPLREPETRSRLWPWILLVGLLFLASMAFGQQPLPQDSQLFQALRSEGFTHCTASDGIRGPLRTVRADFGDPWLCRFPKCPSPGPCINNLPEQVEGGAGHGVGTPWSERARDALDLPQSYTTANDPGRGMMNQWLRYLSTPRQEMAWQYLSDLATAGHRMALSCPTEARINSEIKCLVLSPGPEATWRVRLPERPATGGWRCWLGDCRFSPMTDRAAVPPSGEILWQSDGFPGTATVTAQSQVLGEPGKQAVDAHVRIVVEDTPPPDEPPPPPPDEEPDPPDEPDEPSDCQETLETIRELLCRGS